MAKQGAGFWYNPYNNIAIDVNRHEFDIKDKKQQMRIGLLDFDGNPIHPYEDLIDELNKLSPSKDEDKIKILSIAAGLVRIRDWQDFVSIQFTGQNGKLRGSNLKRLLEMVADLIIGYQNKDFSKMQKQQTKELAKTLSIPNDKNLKIDNISSNSKDVSSSITLTVKDFLKEYSNYKLFEDSEMKKTNKEIRDINIHDNLCEWAGELLKRRGYYQKREVTSLFEDSVVSYSVKENKKVLDEEKLSRVWQMASKDGHIWGIVTGYRGGNTEEKNESLNNELKKDVRQKGFGFWELEGHWQEKDDSGKIKDTIEKSLFVSAPKGTDPNKFLTFMMDMTKKYDQDACIYKIDPEKDAPVMLYQYKTSDGNKRIVDEDHFSIGKFHPNRISQGYSKILGNGRTFIFESVLEIEEIE